MLPKLTPPIPLPMANLWFKYITIFYIMVNRKCINLVHFVWWYNFRKKEMNICYLCYMNVFRLFRLVIAHNFWRVLINQIKKDLWFSYLHGSLHRICYSKHQVLSPPPCHYLQTNRETMNGWISCGNWNRRDTGYVCKRRESEK